MWKTYASGPPLWAHGPVNAPRPIPCSVASPQPVAPSSNSATPAAQHAASVEIIPTLKRKIAMAAASSMRAPMDRRLPVRVRQRSMEKSERASSRGTRVDRKPDREVEHDADHGGGDSRQGRVKSLIAAQRLDVGRAEKNPKEAGCERNPGCQQAAERSRQQRRKAPESRYAAMKPTNCRTMISGPGVVSAMPRPSSISPGLSQP